MFFGSQDAASESPFCRLAPTETASRFSGSFANWVRSAWLSFCAPFYHASSSATTWSMSTFACPRLKYTAVRVYGSRMLPDNTVQRPDRRTARNCRARMSSRVLHPLRPSGAAVLSDHPGPNRPREYPVFGARPLVGSRRSTTRARPVANGASRTIVAPCGADVTGGAEPVPGGAAAPDDTEVVAGLPGEPVHAEAAQAVTMTPTQTIAPARMATTPWASTTPEN